MSFSINGVAVETQEEFEKAKNEHLYQITGVYPDGSDEKAIMELLNTEKAWMFISENAKRFAKEHYNDMVLIQNKKYVRKTSPHFSDGVFYGLRSDYEV